MSKTILIDMDDVIENLLESWCDCLNREYGTFVKTKDITDWNVCKFFSPLTKEQVFEPLRHDEFWKSVKPRADAMEYVERLFLDDYDIYVCTATDYRNLRAKYEYVIERYFPYIEWSHMIVAYRKQMIKADYLVDDGVHNLIGGSYTKLLMTSPHNKNFDAESNGMIRVNDWSEAYKIISHKEKEER